VDPKDESDCTDKRNAIITRAQKMCKDGAHYLWSAEGQMPNDGGTVSFAEVKLDVSALELTTFCAATVTYKNTVYVCTGRFRHPGLANWPPPEKKPILKGQKISADSTDPKIQGLVAFINQYANNKGAQVGWGLKLTPRRVRGNDVTDYQDGKDLDDAVVWGEGCDGTRHFDCGGFVRWVANDVCKTSIAGIKEEVIDKKGNDPPRGELVPEDEVLLPGDILVYKGHIAFALGGETYKKGLGFRIVQAESACYGVNSGKTHSGDIGCIRLLPSTLLGHPVKTTG
jgi:hypothetical protein